MNRLTQMVTVGTLAWFAAAASAQPLSKVALRDIDQSALKLADCAKELHAEFHEHLENVRHAEKLEEDVSALEQIAERMHAIAHDADGSEKSMLLIRRDTNELLQLSSQIGRTIDLAERWVRTPNARTGIVHMRATARDVVRVTLQIDSVLPVDMTVIDGQADRLEQAVKELHLEFHEDLEELEGHVEHMHGLAHNKTWTEVNLQHLMRDLFEVRRLTSHIEELFVRQSRIGVLTRDFIGIEHSRDAISDVLASSYLLEHMIRKADPNFAPRPSRGRPIYSHVRPRRDRMHDDHLGHRSEYLRPSLHDYDAHGDDGHALESYGRRLLDTHRRGIGFDF
jgi:hypothetical protein